MIGWLLDTFLGKVTFSLVRREQTRLGNFYVVSSSDASLETIIKEVFVKNTFSLYTWPLIIWASKVVDPKKTWLWVSWSKKRTPLGYDNWREKCYFENLRITTVKYEYEKVDNVLKIKSTLRHVLKIILYRSCIHKNISSYLALKRFLDFGSTSLNLLYKVSCCAQKECHKDSK